MDLSGLTFRTFSHATEDEEKVREAIRFACGCDEVSKDETSGYHGNPIMVLEAKISGRKIDDFFRRLEKQDLELLLETIEKRVDEESFFFLRLDKQLAYEGILKLSDGEDIIAVRGKIKSYPKKRENSLRVMTHLLKRLVDTKDGSAPRGKN